MQFFGQAPANQFGSAGAYYGTTSQFEPTPIGDESPQLGKEPLLHSRRRRLNICPVSLSVLLPWALFTVTYVVTSFEMHYKQPNLCFLIVVLGFLTACSMGVFGVCTRPKWYSKDTPEPTWVFFLSLSMLLAWVLAVSLGSQNYTSNMRPYFDMSNLNMYTDISVQKTRGQQLMDAGIVNFAEGTTLDISKAMGFMSDSVYCVAPITLGTEKLPTYDFWAVGIGCCSTGAQPHFRCKGFNDPHSHGGLRLMADGSRAFYRLAVQQAEAAYNIKAFHPLFFTWVPDAASSVESWQDTGRANCIKWILAYFVLQSILVVLAVFLFSKMGRL